MVNREGREIIWRRWYTTIIHVLNWICICNPGRVTGNLI